MLTYGTDGFSTDPDDSGTHYMLSFFAPSGATAVLSGWWTVRAPAPASGVNFFIDGDLGVGAASSDPGTFPFSASWTNSGPSKLENMDVYQDWDSNVPFGLRVTVTGGNGDTAPCSAPSASELYGGANPSELACSCTVAEPVDVGSGNYTESVTDVSLPDRGVPLSIGRSYDSLAAGVQGAFGFGWSSVLDAGVAVDTQVSPAVATVTQENGSTVAFTQSPSGGWVPPSWVFATLTQNGDGSWTMLRRARTTLGFDPAGKLVSIGDLNGDEETLTRNSSEQVTSVSDSAGHVVAVSWSGGHVSALRGVGGDPGWSVSYGYDGAGNLSSVTDQAGHTSGYGYSDPNGAHLLSSITDALGNVVTANVYDAGGQVVKQTDADGGVTTIGYTPGAASVTDPTGVVTDYTFGGGLVASRTVGVGSPTPATTTWYYDPVTFGMAAVTDANGNTSGATYDAFGDQVGTYDAYKTLTAATYDSSGLGEQLTYKDGTGVTTTRTYDTKGNLLTSSTPVAGSGTAVTTFGHGDANHPGDVTSVTDPTGRVTAYAYNAAGQPTSITDPSGGVTTIGYDAAGRQVWMVGPAGNAPGANPAAFRSTQMLDHAGEPVEQGGPGAAAISDGFARPDGPLGDADTGEAWQSIGGGTWSVSGGAATQSAPGSGPSLAVVAGQASSVSTVLTEAGEPAGAGVAFRVQDASDYWAVVANPAGGDWQIEKVLGGQVTVVDSVGACCTLGQAIEAVSSGSEVQVLLADKIVYEGTDSDLAGVPGAGLIAPAAGTARFDAFITAGLAPGATVTGAFYDADERPVTTIGAEGGVTSTTYDNAGRPTSVTDADQHTTSTAYDPDGRVHIQTDANNNQSVYTYNAQGRLASSQAPGKPAVAYTYAYGPGGEVDTVTLADGNTAATTLDADERPASVSYTNASAPNVTAIKYDGDGRRTSMTTGSSTSSWTYDSLGRLTSSTRAGSKVTYTWDLAGRLTTIGYPSAGTATLGYNPGGQWTSVTDWNHNTTSFGYGPDEQPNTVTYPNGIAAQIVDNAASVPSSITYTSSGATVAGWSVARNPDETLAQVTAVGVGDSFDYGYDPAGQLTAATDTTNPAGSGGYGYDPAGNLATNTVAAQGFDSSEELCWAAPTPASGTCTAPPAGATTYSYDADGRRTTSTAPGGVSSFGWNAADQLTSTATPGAGTITYDYDGDGLLTSSASGGTTTPLAWDETGAVPRLLEQGSTSYLYGPGGVPVEQTSPTGGAQWLVTDTTGSVRALTNSAGAVIGTTSYTPWGAPTATTGTQSVLGDAGEPYNPAAGLYYLQARWYDPTTGQFLSPDPLDALTRQAYQYADNDPINESDPSGLYWGQGVLHELVNNAECNIHAITSTIGDVGDFLYQHRAGILQGAALVVGIAAATTGVGALADATFFGLAPIELGQASVIIGVIGLAPDVSSCLNHPGLTEACTGTALSIGATLLGGGSISIASKFASDLLGTAGIIVGFIGALLDSIYPAGRSIGRGTA